MLVIRSIKQMQSISARAKASGKRICIVPTMGALHEGHLSLIKRAAEVADIVVTTLFVNPKQFAANEDYGKYPRNFDRDSELAAVSGSDYLFFPDVEEMYDKDFSVNITVGMIADKFEGSFRSGHFDGVSTVVAKLFNAVIPDYAIFGQKDYQQCMLINKLIKDLNFNIEMMIAPTVREADGLAMSSRNAYLSQTEREQAVILYKALTAAAKEISLGERNREKINHLMCSTLSRIESIRIDYAAAAVDGTLAEPENFAKGDKIVLLIAVKLGNTRLIDNMIV